MTSSSEGEILQNSQIIRERWKIKCKMGGGGFGEIYEAIDLQSHNERVAVKVESAKATKQVLKMEVAVLRRLQGKKHACKFYGCGRNDKYNYLVMSLQGKNLADLRRESPKQMFSVSTAVRLASQILASIREIHATGFLHRDIKPSNFAMGRTASTMRIVYMLDFGLARLYLNARGEIRSPRLAAGFRGTVRYAAVSAHKNKEMGRQDDLWSLFYMLIEFLQGALPWRRIKDKDEVGKMKEDADIEQLLDGCPYELLEIPKHLKTLSYPDEPNYDLLERCLWSCMARLGINMDDPYDWEIGYENVSGRSKTTTNTTTNGNISTRMRSHTTAVKERGPDEKNRAMDTQAPITMGEYDDDEQTGNYNFKFPQALGNSVKSSQNDENAADKPKYKRTEFMKPKYGAVSFDVIDAVNARLARADSVQATNNGQSNEALFSRMRIETSVENAPQIYGTNRATVEATIEQPPTTQEDKSKPAPASNSTKSQKSLTLSANGKRYQNGSKRNVSATVSTNAIATENPNEDVGAQRKNQTILSRWQDSFDDSVDEDAGRSPMFARNKQLDSFVNTNNHLPQSPTMNGDLSGFLSPRSSRRLMPASKSIQPLLHLTNQNGTSNGHAIQNGKNPGPFPAAPPTLHPPGSPKQTPKSNGNQQVNTTSNTSNGGGGLISHFRSFVNNAASNAVDQIRKHSFSRGVSLDETRNRQQYANKKHHSSQKQSSQQQTNGQTSPASSSSGFGSQNANDVQPSRKLTHEEEERDIRRQRRLRRRSDCQSMFPQTITINTRKDTSLSPTRSGKTIVITPIGSDSYANPISNNRFVVNDSSSQNLDKSGSCRRKRYQFLSFAPRAISRS